MDRFNCSGIEFKFDAADGKSGTFSGYGAIFGNTDSYGDVIEHGAFKDTLRDWQAKGKWAPMLLQHGGFFGGVDDMLPVGVWTSMEENSKGLRVEGKLFALDTERGTYIYEGMKAGALDGLSIGYRAKKFTMGTKPNEPRRRLEAVDLVELSIVTFPANDKARVGNVKTADIDRITSLSEAEALLREAGGCWSKASARDFVSRLSKIARREAGDDRSVDRVNGLLTTLQSARRQISPLT